VRDGQDGGRDAEREGGCKPRSILRKTKPFQSGPDLAPNVPQSGAAFDWACCIYATAPFLSADHLNEGFLRLKRSGRSFAFAVTSFNFPIQRALRILPDGTLDAIWPEHRATRSQDLEPAYHDAGQFYWGRTSAFRERREVFSPESTPVVLPRELVHDIDTPEDWANAELAFAALRLAEGRRL
jgi:pseudaminic acid cytidylyltransferase